MKLTYIFNGEQVERKDLTGIIDEYIISKMENTVVGLDKGGYMSYSWPDLDGKNNTFKVMK